MRRAGKIFALALLVSTLALAGASAAEKTPSSPDPGQEITQGFVNFGHGVRDGAVGFGHGVRDGAVNAWGAVKSAFNGNRDTSEKPKGSSPQGKTSGTASDGK